MSGINLKLLADVSSVIKGSKDAAGSLEEVIGSLDEIAREGDATERALDSNLDEIGRSSEQLTDKLERDFREAFDAAKRESRDAGDAVSRNTRRGFDDANDKVKDFKDEAKQNFSEVASSFQGDLDSAVDGVQGTLGGLAMSPALGPVGMIAAAGGAAAAGFYSAWKKNAENMKLLIQAMYDDMLESGERFLSDSYAMEQYYAILQDKENDLGISKEEAQAHADAIGIPIQRYVAAITKGGEELSAVLDITKAKQEEVGEAGLKAAPSEKARWGAVASELQNVNEQLTQQRDRIEETADQVGKDKAGWSAWGSTASDAVRKQNEQLGKVYDSIAKVKDSVKTIPNAKIRVGVDTSNVRREVEDTLKRDFKIGVVVGNLYGKGIQ